MVRDGTDRVEMERPRRELQRVTTAHRAAFLRREADRVAASEALRPLGAALARRACELDLREFVLRLQRGAALGGVPAA